MKRYNIFDLIELIDDLERVRIISLLSDTEKKILGALGDAEYYNSLTLQELEQVTKIPYRTLKRLVAKLEAFGLLLTFRDAIKVVGLNPALMQKKDIFRAVRLNMLRIAKLETEQEKLKNQVADLQKLKPRVEELEQTTKKYAFLERSVAKETTH